MESNCSILHTRLSVQVLQLAEQDKGKKLKDGGARKSLFQANGRTALDPPKHLISGFTHHTPLFHSKSLALLRCLQLWPECNVDRLWYSTLLKVGQVVSDSHGTFIVAMVTPHSYRALECKEHCSPDGSAPLLLPVCFSAASTYSSCFTVLTA
jgi:hypothetical protein